nr:MAG TPA: hypothetical protein [Caudoviricetes sp.]
MFLHPTPRQDFFDFLYKSFHSSLILAKPP